MEINQSDKNIEQNLQNYNISTKKDNNIINKDLKLTKLIYNNYN